MTGRECVTNDVEITIPKKKNWVAPLLLYVHRFMRRSKKRVWWKESGTIAEVSQGCQGEPPEAPLVPFPTRTHRFVFVNQNCISNQRKFTTYTIHVDEEDGVKCRLVGGGGGNVIKVLDMTSVGSPVRKINRPHVGSVGVKGVCEITGHYYFTRGQFLSIAWYLTELEKKKIRGLK